MVIIIIFGTGCVFVEWAKIVRLNGMAVFWILRQAKNILFIRRGLMWKIERLIEFCGQNRANINGKWIAARPLNWKFRSLKERIKDALAVFRGTAEAFKWYQQ